MLSRIADSLYWLNRYMERADNLLRLTYVHYILSLDRDVYSNKTWKQVLETFSWSNSEEISALENNTPGALKNLLIDHSNANSLKIILSRARENARGVQDHITKEVWGTVNQMYHLVNDVSITEKLDNYEEMQVIDLFMKQSTLYAGVTELTMSRGMGWDFMNLGKYIERSYQTIMLTEKHLQSVSFMNEADNILQWRYLLLSLSGYELHLKTYRSANHDHNVLHQIVLNENFTRSILYSLNHIQIYLQRVSKKEDEENARLLRHFGRLHCKVQFMDLEVLNKKDLELFLSELKSDLFGFSKHFSEYFFSYS